MSQTDELLSALASLIEHHDYIGLDVDEKSSGEWEAMEGSIAMTKARELLKKMKGVRNNGTGRDTTETTCTKKPIQ